MAPSLPGYGLSFRSGQRRFGVEEIADCVAALMHDRLGYTKFAVQGGDWGAIIASRLGHAHPDKLIGIHVNLLAIRRDPPDSGNPTPEERRYAEELALWLREETGYQSIQGTKPQTLAFGLTDSPAGLAAWIVEKFRTWSDCGGDIETVFRKTSSLPTSASIGSPVRSAPRSSLIITACTGPGRSRKAGQLTFPPGTQRFRARSCVHPDRLRRAPIATSAAGARCRGAVILPRWNSLKRWPTRCGNSSGRYVLEIADAMVEAAQAGISARQCGQPERRHAALVRRRRAAIELHGVRSAMPASEYRRRGSRGR